MTMRTLLRLLAAAAAFCALESPAADAQTVWSVSTLSARGGSLIPAPVRPSAADAAGNLYVVANQADASSPCIVTLKYAPESGAIAWRQELCAGAGTLATALSLDGNGDAIVLAASEGTYRLLKYSGATGRLLWDRASSGTAVTGYSLAVDASGDVVMLGTSRGFTLDLWIVKHRGADGAMAWQQPVDSGADVTPAGIALDAAGNAFVAGSYRNARGDEDWNLAKLAGSSGALLWRKIFD